LDLNLPNNIKIPKLEQFLKNVLSTYNIETVILFGSVAKGTYNYRSDIDLLIVTNDMGSDWFERHQKAYSMSIGLVQPFV